MRGRRWQSIWTLCLAILLFGGPAAVLARDDTLPVTPGAGRYLPAATELGADWIDVWQAGIDPGAELFKEGVKGVYGGPGGSRAIVFAWVIQDSVTAVRRSWEATTDLFDSFRYETADNYDYSAVDDLKSMDPPPGCVEASRAEGASSKQQFPAGITLCAVDPDVVVLAIVSGELDGKQGYAASDALIATVLEHAGQAGSQ